VKVTPAAPSLTLQEFSPAPNVTLGDDMKPLFRKQLSLPGCAAVMASYIPWMVSASLPSDSTSLLSKWRQNPQIIFKLFFEL